MEVFTLWLPNYTRTCQIICFQQILQVLTLLLKTWFDGGEYQTICFQQITQGFMHATEMLKFARQLFLFFCTIAIHEMENIRNWTFVHYFVYYLWMLYSHRFCIFFKSCIQQLLFSVASWLCLLTTFFPGGYSIYHVIWNSFFILIWLIRVNALDALILDIVLMV